MIKELILSVVWLAPDCAQGYLQDGTRVFIQSPSTVIVTLPTAEQEARYRAALSKREAHADWERRRKAAIAMKLAEPERSLASIAREMNLSASSLGKWVKAARAA